MLLVSREVPDALLTIITNLVQISLSLLMFQSTSKDHISPENGVNFIDMIQSGEGLLFQRATRSEIKMNKSKLPQALIPRQFFSGIFYRI